MHTVVWFIECSAPLLCCGQVAFSSFTDFGVYMAMAVALHNIPEGLIVAGKPYAGCCATTPLLVAAQLTFLKFAAPIYAATGSRRQALGMALASVRALELAGRICLHN